MATLPNQMNRISHAAPLISLLLFLHYSDLVNLWSYLQCIESQLSIFLLISFKEIWIFKHSHMFTLVLEKILKGCRNLRCPVIQSTQISLTQIVTLYFHSNCVCFDFYEVSSQDYTPKLIFQVAIIFFQRPSNFSQILDYAF